MMKKGSRTFSSALKAFFFGAVAEEPPSHEEALHKEAMEVKKALMRAYGNFNEYTDSEMTEYGIYEIKALETRYSHILRELKNL